MILATNSNNMKTNKYILYFISIILIFSMPSSYANNTNIECTAGENSTICKNSTDAFEIESPEKLLPAYRWDNFTFDGKYNEILGIIEIDPLSELAGVAFTIANFIWSITLFFAKTGLNFDIITPLSPTINKGVSVFSSNSILGPILIIALILLLYTKLLRPMFSNRGTGTIGLKNFTDLLFPFLIIGFVLSLGVQSNKAISNYENSPENSRDTSIINDTKGTVTWYVTKASNAVSNIGSTITQSVTGTTKTLDFSNSLKNVGKKINNSNQSTDGDTLTCENYNKTLNDTFLSTKNLEPSLITLSSLNTLWEESYYRSFKNSLFGTPIPNKIDFGGRIACQYLETYNNIDSIQRSAILNASTNLNFKSNAPIFSTYNSNDNKLTQTLVFALCQNKGKEIFYNTTYFIPPVSSSANSECSDVFYKKGLLNNVVDNAVNVGKNAASLNPVKTAQSVNGIFQNDFNQGNFDIGKIQGKNPESNKFLSTLKGDQINKLLGGIIALLVSLVFLWTFGFISIGLIFVNITSVILLTLLPLLLIAYVILGKQQQVKLKALFKLLGIAIATKFIFTIIIVLLIQITKITTAMVSTFPFTQGFIGNIITGFMPIVSLLIVRKILQAFSLGDIMKAGGAMSLAWKAQNQALSGTKEGQSIVGKINNKVNKIPGIDKVGNKLDKLDRYGPKSSAKAALSKKYRVERKKLNEKERQEVRTLRKEKRENRDSDQFLSDKIKDKFNSYGVSFDSIEDGARSVAKKVGDVSKPLAIGAAAGAAAGAVIPGLIGAGSIEAVNEYRNKKNNKSSINSNQDNPDGQSVKKEKVGNNTSIQQKSRELKRNRLKAIKDGKVKDFDKETFETALSGYKTNLYGQDIDYFTSNKEKNASIDNYALLNGYESSDLLASENGIIIPNPNIPRNELTAEQLKHWTFSLDKETIKKNNGENNDEYINRLFATAVQRGLISTDGEVFNPYEYHNLDENSSNIKLLSSSLINLDDNKYKISSKDSSIEKQICDTILSGIRQNKSIETKFERAEEDIKNSSKNNSVRYNKNESELFEFSDKINEIKKQIHDTIDIDVKNQLERDLTSMKNIYLNKFQDSMKDQLQYISEIIVDSTEVSLLGTNADSDTVIKHINDQLIDVFNMIDDMEIIKTNFLQGNKSSIELIEALQNFYKLGKTKTAETINNMELSKELKKSDINFDIEKIGDIGSKKELSKVVDKIGSSKFPIGGR